MRVPTLQAPRVGSTDLPSVSPQLRAPDGAASALVGAVGRGMTKLGEAADNAIDSQQAAVAKARREAAALSETDKLLEQQERAQRRLRGASGSRARIDDAFDGIDTSKGGFLASRGLKASEGSADIIDALEKDQQEIAATIADPEARARFAVKSREQLLAYRKQVEEHASKEFETAKAETMKARIGQAIGMASAGVPDFDAWHIISKQTESAIDELAPSPEVADAQKAAFRSENGFALVQGLLAQGRVDEAKQYVEQFRPDLAKRYVDAKALVDRAGAGAEKDRVAGQIAGLVDTTAEAVRTPDGYVTEEELRKAVRPEGYEGQQRDQVEAEIRQRAQAERAKFKADGDKHRDNVNRSDLPGNARAGESELWLEKYDPDFLLARQARKQAQHDRWVARQNGTPTERTAAAKQQDADDEGYRYRVQRRVREDPTLTPEQIEVEYIADMKKKYGRNVAVSPAEIERAGAFAVDFQQKVGTKEGAADKANGARVEKAVVAAIKRGLPKGGKVDPAALNDEVGRDMYLLQAKIEANGGKPLNELQWSEFEEQITAELTIEKPGRVYGTNTVNVGRAGQQPVYGPEAPASPPPSASTTKRPTATGKNGEKYQLSEDGKSWEPIK